MAPVANLLSAASSLCEIMSLGEDRAALLIEDGIVKFCLSTAC